MLNIKALLAKVLQSCYIETEQNVTANLTPLASSGAIASFGYINISRPSDVPLSAIPELRETNGQGWLAPMSGGGLRFIAPATSGSRTLKICWRYLVGGVLLRLNNLTPCRKVVGVC